MKKLSEKRRIPKKTRFIFGRDMSLEEMVDAVVRMVKEYGIHIVDDRKKYGIPIVDSRKKERKAK
jgi:hypothetical protein